MKFQDIISAHDYAVMHGFKLGYPSISYARKQMCPMMAILIDKYQLDPNELNADTLQIIRQQQILERQAECDVGTSLSLLELIANQKPPLDDDLPVEYAEAFSIFSHLPRSFLDRAKVSTDYKLMTIEPKRPNGPVDRRIKHLMRHY